MQVKREYVLTILAPPLIFLSGFLTYIIYHDYGVFTPEAILSMALITLAGILIGVPLAISGLTRFRAFCLAVLLFIFFDIQFNLINTIYAYLASEPVLLHRYILVIVTLFITQLMIIGVHKHIATIITAIFAVTMLATIILPIQRESYGVQPVAALTTPESDLPPIIHLVLDGHIGIEGIPLDIEGGAELKNLLLQFYEHWGFRLYGRAYSKYLMTEDSITNLLNGQTSPVNASLAEVTHEHGKDSWKPVQNDYFRKFSDAGYRIRVFQAEYLDYCQDFTGKIEECYQYPSSSPRLLREMAMPVKEKAEYLLGSYFVDATIFRIIQEVYNNAILLLPNNRMLAWKHKNYAFSSLGVPSVITRLKMDITNNSRGRLFFAHILLPHGPYVWDKNCQTRNDSNTWLSRRMEHENLLTLSDAQYRETAYRYYFQQAVCTVSLLNDLLESLSKDGLLNTATIIIHGDHGSRITVADPITPMAGYLTDRDFIDGFSTLFAIRSGTTEPGYDGHYRAIQNLFGELLLDIPAVPDDGKVLLLTGPRVQMSPLEAVSMPEF